MSKRMGKLSAQFILCRHMNTQYILCTNPDLDLWLHSFNSLRMHLSRDLLLLDILIFVKIRKERCSFEPLNARILEGTLLAAICKQSLPLVNHFDVTP